MRGTAEVSTQKYMHQFAYVGSVSMCAFCRFHVSVNICLSVKMDTSDCCTFCWISVAFTNLQLGGKFNKLTFSVHTNVFNGCKCFNKATFSSLKCQVMLSVTELNYGPASSLV